MHKKLTKSLLVAAMAAACTSLTFAQTTPTTNKPATTTPQTTATKSEKPVTTIPQATAKKAEQPAASPGWVVIEEEWMFPHWFSFSDALHNARTHYRAHEEKSAAAEIDKAVSWLKYAEKHADQSYASELATAEADLDDFAMTLRQGGKVPAAKVATAFKHASIALAKHHHFKSSQAIAESDMKTAAKHLLAAADLVKEAARSANREYGKEIAVIDEYYSPFGYWDETVTLDKTMLEKNLDSVATELGKLANELK